MISREIKIGGLAVGGSNPVRVQAMLKSSAGDASALIKEGRNLVKAGAEIIRCAVPEKGQAKKLYSILKELPVPLIADCHFTKTAAVEALDSGFDKIRVNPGNMSAQAIMDSVKKASEKKAALRLGFNTGSCRVSTPQELANIALTWDEKIKKTGFKNFVVSMKSSSVKFTVEANRFFSVYSNTPLHIGVTASGSGIEGIMKSAAGIGCLLLDGVGDTVRVSVTGDSLQEVKAARILRAIASGEPEGLEIISCPTCSRSRIDVEKISVKFRKSLSSEDFKKKLRVAIMGCEVNGPGEAKECDTGICGTRKGALLISRGKITCAVEEKEIIKKLVEEIRKRKT